MGYGYTCGYGHLRLRSLMGTVIIVVTVIVPGTVLSTFMIGVMVVVKV